MTTISERYRRAEARSQLVADLEAMGMQVVPHRIGGMRRFWYERSLMPGNISWWTPCRHQPPSLPLSDVALGAKG